ncbi:MAG: SUMF1/EgtB/PvdO family nonheme iron enzyme [Acidobacteriota bacterium]
MSPEQGRGKKGDHRSDLYSLGIVFYHMLAGRVPYIGDNPVGIMFQHVNEPVPSLKMIRPELPNHLDEILQKLLAKDPDSRYQSANEMLCDIEGRYKPQVDNNLQREQRTSPIERASPSRRLIYIIGAAMCLVAAAIIFTLALFWNRMKPIDESRSSSPPHSSSATSNPQLFLADGTPKPFQPENANPTEGDIWREVQSGMEFAWIPSGEFRMGWDAGKDQEKPVHIVALDGYWMGRTEVTQGQWREFMPSNPSYFREGIDYPVESVSWNDVQEFIRRMNYRTGLKFRLPTEAEWEYACRAGLTEERNGMLNDIAWFRENSDGRMHPVKQMRPNAWGLYDMLGNVSEWCEDWYGSYTPESVKNPKGPTVGTARVVRDGSWADSAVNVYNAGRDGVPPNIGGNCVGFRLARDK